ncbi:protein rep (plasmid) [Enterococcus faecalis]|uniref:protein rep n=1 Tax=Enterococcus faecalis TaxID=1351 RepID=UPI00200E51AA|nr:protein rep [Enterococcus faecalis]UQF15374.1 protein rep [Enterococcus faecalis]
MLNYNELERNSKVLNDKRPNGKTNDWRNKKRMNEQYAEILDVLHYLKASKVSACADTLRFRVTDTGHLKLYQTWFCKSRLCPICSWRRSILHAYQVKQIVTEAVKREPKGRWLFLTLTTKNTTNAQDLASEISKMNTALRNLFRRKKVAKNLLGFLRATEVTVNKENCSYNQHMHVLLFVKSSYFKGSDNFISQEDWRNLWQQAMKLDYEPSVNIKAIKPKNKETGEKGLIGSVYEVAKYPVKATDFLNGSDEDNQTVVDDLEQALNRKRLIAYGGLLKIIQKELNLADAEDEKADLIHTGEEIDGEETEREVVATWDKQRKNYFIKD